MLDSEVNYIVSGLERSGTSMMMQMLVAGGVPVAFDGSRPSDVNNPRGYFELEGGKIINRLMGGSFPFADFRGMFVKITAFGLQYLPRGRYCVIYMQRNIDEILDSMEKMIGKKDLLRDETKTSFLRLDMKIKNMLLDRDDIRVLFVNYNKGLNNPEVLVDSVVQFLGQTDVDKDKMLGVVDKRLYRQRRSN